MSLAFSVAGSALPTPGQAPAALTDNDLMLRLGASHCKREHPQHTYGAPARGLQNVLAARTHDLALKAHTPARNKPPTTRRPATRHPPPRRVNPAASACAHNAHVLDTERRPLTANCTPHIRSCSLTATHLLRAFLHTTGAGAGLMDRAFALHPQFPFSEIRPIPIFHDSSTTTMTGTK
ncbi:hypothetical protein GGX14DRAFT_580523 [Mycena pura]|uniref:Uncharacterized protein n=1 Tax=Mycena pura TaxID=153505 RepID=A0AAD6UPS3_9AGAR|nr:hypothetical protein GGX14DRAFT_580523 [Mycena pura]